MARCIGYVCESKGVSKTPRQLAEFVGVEERHLSSANQYLNLVEKSKIGQKVRENTIRDYTRQLLEKFDILLFYEDFIIDLIRQSIASHLHPTPSGKDITKVAGCVYMLTTRFAKYRTINSDRTQNSYNGIRAYH